MFDADKSVLLCLDFTAEIVEGYASDGPAVVRAATGLAALARANGMPVIHVFPVRNCADDLQVVAEPSDLVIGKVAIGAFSSAELARELSSRNRNTIVLSGVATSGTVLSTARWAFDVGLSVCVVEDACSDPDPAVHDLLVGKTDSPSWVGLHRVAEVASVGSIAAAIGHDVGSQH
jgi:nicotinamidase-related amidase